MGTRVTRVKNWNSASILSFYRSARILVNVLSMAWKRKGGLWVNSLAHLFYIHLGSAEGNKPGYMFLPRRRKEKWLNKPSREIIPLGSTWVACSSSSNTREKERLLLLLFHHKSGSERLPGFSLLPSKRIQDSPIFRESNLLSEICFYPQGVFKVQNAISSEEDMVVFTPKNEGGRGWRGGGIVWPRDINPLNWIPARGGVNKTMWPSQNPFPSPAEEGQGSKKSQPRAAKKPLCSIARVKPLTRGRNKLISLYGGLGRTWVVESR